MLDQKMSAQIAALAILVCTAVPPQAYAHHGAVGHPTLYLAENLIEFEGEITAVLWRNPHPRMRMSVTEGNGEEAIWELAKSVGRKLHPKTSRTTQMTAWAATVPE
mgnify:CR=1 FL=1